MPLPALGALFARLGLGARAGRVATATEPLVATGVRQTLRRQQQREDSSDRVERYQRAADIAGVADPSGVVDAGNAITYAIRGVMDPSRRKEHFQDALISAIGIIPYLGDIAKIPRLTRGARAARGGGTTVTRTAGLPGPRATAPLAPRSPPDLPRRSDRASAYRQYMRDRAEAARDAGGALPGAAISGRFSSAQASDALSRGRTFGDVMAGKVPLETAVRDNESRRREAEGEEEEVRAREKLARVTGQLTLGFGSLVLGAVALQKSIHAVGSAMIARQRELSHLDPTIAFAAARLDIGRTQRQIERGQLTGTSFRELSNAVNELERELAPYQAAAVNVSNRILEVLTRGVTYVIKIAEDVVPGLEDWVKELNKTLSKKEAEGMAPYVQLLDDLAKGRLSKPRKRRRL